MQSEMGNADETMVSTMAAVQEDDMVVESGLILVDEMQSHGINAGDINKLKAAGVLTVAGVVMRTPKALCAIRGLSEAKVEKLMAVAKTMCSASFVTGNQAAAKRQQVFHLTTGSTALDALLGGGVESCSITEVSGEFRTGKTQLAHTLAVRAQLSRADGGGAGKVAYIDTEGTFRPDRIRAMAIEYGLDAEEVLENILVARAHTHEHQIRLIEELAAKMVEERFALIIVDSIMALFRVDFTGRGELQVRQSTLNGYLNMMQKTAEEYNVAVFVTNQVMSDPGGGMTFVADPKRPVGGHVLNHACTTRIMLRKGKGEQRIAKLIDSPSCPESDAIFALANRGVIDAAD